MKKVPCYSTHLGCADRRRHWATPDTPRGVQYVEMPDSWDELRPVFCSIECALRAGIMTFNPDESDRCKRCARHHAKRWVCV